MTSNLARWHATLIELAKSGSEGYRWEGGTARYRDNATGRFVAEATITKHIDHYNDTVVVQNVSKLADRLVGGMELDVWQRAMSKEIKDAYLVNLQIGRGGKAQTTFADYGRIGGRLRFEYAHINAFAQQIKEGKLSAAQIAARAKQYANGPRTAFFDGVTAAKGEAGLTEERRVLNPAEHCPDCEGYAAVGWVPIGTLPEPGEGSRCYHNCRCHKEYR